MNEQTPPPAPSQPAATPPPPPPPAAVGDDKASGGKRGLGVLFVLILAFGAAVMFAAGAEISDTAPCDDPAAVAESGKFECFDGSSGLKSAVVALMYASGAVGAAAVLIGLAFVFTGRRGRLFGQVAVAAVVLAGLSLLIGQL